MEWSIEFYKRVADDVLGLSPKLQAKLLRILELIEAHGPNLGEPYTKAMGDGLFEIRAKAMEGIARGLFCYLNGDKIMVLHVFVKKSQKTPKKDIVLARKRMQEVRI